MQGLRAGNHAVAKPALVAENDVVASQVKLLKSERIQWKVKLLFTVGKRQTVNERGSDVPALPMRRHTAAIIERRIQRGFGIETNQGLENIFCATELIEPVVDEGKGH